MSGHPTFLTLMDTKVIPVFATKDIVNVCVCADVYTSHQYFSF